MPGVTVTDLISASPDKVWRVVGDVAGIAKWVPALEHSESKDQGATRTCRLGNGMGEITEQVVSRDDKNRSYSYIITGGSLPMRNYLGTIVVEDAGQGKSRVRWACGFEVDGQAENAEQMIRQVFSDGLANLRNIVK